MYLLYSISTFMLYLHTLISAMATCTCNCIIPNCLFVISIFHIKYNGLPDLKKVNLSLERKMSIMCGEQVMFNWPLLSGASGVVHILRNHFLGSRETPPPLCNIVIIWAYPPLCNTVIISPYPPYVKL